VTVGDLVAGVFISTGSLALVLAAIGAALPRSALVRLHYLNLATMVGAPLVLLGLVVHDPADWFKLLAVVALLAGTSPAASAATARALTRSEAGERGIRP
jgi:multisubunit Na+/H+ antiporter MnhG subunit